MDDYFELKDAGILGELFEKMMWILDILCRFLSSNNGDRMTHPIKRLQRQNTMYIHLNF